MNCNLSQSVEKWETLRVEFRHNTEVSIDLWSWTEDVPGARTTVLPTEEALLGKIKEGNVKLLLWNM